MPVYEPPDGGHSTHVYGALVPWIQGEIFRWTAPNNVSGRVLTLVSALAAVTLLAVTMRGDPSRWYFAIAWAAILGVNHRSGQYFAENRPDMTAILFATAGVLLLGLWPGARTVASGRAGDGLPGGRLLLQADGVHLRRGSRGSRSSCDGGSRAERRSCSRCFRWPSRSG